MNLLVCGIEIIESFANKITSDDDKISENVHMISVKKPLYSGSQPFGTRVPPGNQ